MAPDPTRIAHGALAGSAAAILWAAQEPLDQRVFGVPYSDPGLLGSFVASGAAGWAAGHALHLANGTLFGMGYALVARRLPGPPWARGALAGMAEHLATWPATRWLHRLHPRPSEIPHLWGSPAAFAQATWRHLLFGVALGVAEARLDGRGPGRGPEPSGLAVEGNGRGSAEHLLVT
jgi:hypothetical protein